MYKFVDIYIYIYVYIFMYTYKLEKYSWKMRRGRIHWGERGSVDERRTAGSRRHAGRSMGVPLFTYFKEAGESDTQRILLANTGHMPKFLAS